MAEETGKNDVRPPAPPSTPLASTPPAGGSGDVQVGRQVLPDNPIGRTVLGDGQAATHKAAAPHYDKEKRLTRAGMEAVIDGGGSVLVGKQLVTRKSDLPTEADLAGDDEQLREQARQNLAARRKQLDDEEARLNATPSRQPGKANAGGGGGQRRGGGGGQQQ